MMLSNPPPSHIANNSEVPWTQAPPDIPIRHLMVLMDTASKIQLPRKGEITPVLALKRIRNDERYGLLTRQQFDNLTRLLQSKSRCYGYVLAIDSSALLLTFTALVLFLRSSWWMTHSAPSLMTRTTASAVQNTLTTLALDVIELNHILVRLHVLDIRRVRAAIACSVTTIFAMILTSTFGNHSLPLTVLNTTNSLRTRVCYHECQHFLDTATTKSLYGILGVFKSCYSYNDNHLGLTTAFSLLWAGERTV